MLNEYEKILPLSAREYCESQGKSLSDYVVKGVHVVSPSYWSALWDIADKVHLRNTCSDDLRIPKDKRAEVVTDLEVVIRRRLFSKDSYSVFGTALFPKPEGEQR